MQVLEDGKAAAEEIGRRLAISNGTQADAPATEDAVVQPQQPEVSAPELEEIAKLKADLEAQRREFDRKWGERGATMERLKATLAAREERIEALEADLAATKPGQGERTMDESIQALHDEYGEDFVNGVSKLTGTRFEELEKKIDRAEQQFKSIRDESDAKAGARTYWDEFERIAPGALALNGDPTLGVPANPDFVAYLDQEIPLFEGSSVKRTRRKLAEELNASGDLNGLAEIFMGFAPKTTTPQRDIRDQVSPRSSRAVSQTPPESSSQNKPVYKESEMDAFFRSIQDGADVTTAEMKTKQQQFNDAAREGRIQWGK
jgi:hypothetical protein